MSSEPAPDRATVLVTGATGYIAGWTIVRLLQRGYRVRATLRSMARAQTVRAAVAGQIDPGDRLSFVTADLLRDEGWDRAAEGCDYVIHMASPLGTAKNRGVDLVRSATEGTRRALEASARAGVRRVVVTSSIAAARSAPTKIPSVETDESFWTDPNAKDSSPYIRSKTLAERFAWDFAAKSGGALSLATVLPAFVVGPVLGPDTSGSIDIVRRPLIGKLPGIVRLGFSLVDVRDVADLHVLAMLEPKAAGERFIASAGFLWMADIARLLREHLGPRAAKVPTRRIPDVLLHLVALFDSDVRQLTSSLGLRRHFLAEKAKNLLGWAPRDVERPSSTAPRASFAKGWRSSRIPVPMRGRERHLLPLVW